MIVRTFCILLLALVAIAFAKKKTSMRQRELLGKHEKKIEKHEHASKGGCGKDGMSPCSDLTVRELNVLALSAYPNDFRGFDRPISVGLARALMSHVEANKEAKGLIEQVMSFPSLGESLEGLLQDTAASAALDGSGGAMKTVVDFVGKQLANEVAGKIVDVAKQHNVPIFGIPVDEIIAGNPQEIRNKILKDYVMAGIDHHLKDYPDWAMVFKGVTGDWKDLLPDLFAKAILGQAWKTMMEGCMDNEVGQACHGSNGVLSDCIGATLSDNSKWLVREVKDIGTVVENKDSGIVVDNENTLLCDENSCVNKGGCEAPYFPACLNPWGVAPSDWRRCACVMKIEPWDTDRERRICYIPLGGMSSMDGLVEGNTAGVSMPSVK